MAYGAIYRKTLNLNSRVKARLAVLLGVTLVTAACATGPLWSPPPEGAADPRAAAPEFTFVSDTFAFANLIRPRPPGAGCARDRERAARGAARAAPGHQLAQARAEPHRRRVRVARRGLHRRLRRLGPERPRRAGDRHLRSSRGALLGDPGLRYRARRDPGLSHVLLTAPLRVARLRVAVRAGGRRGAAVRAAAAGEASL